MRRNYQSIVCFLALSVLLSQSVYSAGTEVFMQHFDAAQNFLEQGQYSSAIVEYRKALRINYLDNSARIGLINSYLTRATFYANQEKNYNKAANDFRSALFYLKIYPPKEQTVANSASLISSATENLNQCLTVTGFDKTSSSRYKKAEELRAIGNFSASAYEFSRAAQNENISASSYTQVADLLKLLGNEPRSADYYKMALDLKSDDGLLRMKYARTLDKLGRFDDAVIQYNYALEHSKGDMEVLYALERIYLKKLAVTPSDAELNANIGAIKQAQGDFDAALSYYGKAEQLNPSNVNTRLNVGTLFQQKREYAKAIKSYDSVLTLYPDNVQANLYKAQALSEMGDKKTAVSLYKKVLSLEPDNAIAKREIASVLSAAMTTDEYLNYLSQNSSDKNMKAILYDYAYKLHKENNLDGAIKAYKAFLASDSSKADAYVNLAICYAAKNDYKNAVATLNTANAKHPNNALILKTLKDVKGDSIAEAFSMATESFKNKDYKNALDLYLQVTPETSDSLLGVAACYQQLDNLPKAIEYYKKAETIAPKDALIPYYIGYLYSEQQKWIEAEGYLRKSIKISPDPQAQKLLEYIINNSVLTMLNQGIDLFEKNKYDEALTKFNQVLNKDKENAYAYYYRGVIFDDKKQTQNAINDYLSTIKYTKDIPIAHYMLAVDYDALGKYNDAVRYYKQFISAYTTDDEYLKYAKARVEELKGYAG